MITPFAKAFAFAQQWLTRKQQRWTLLRDMKARPSNVAELRELLSAASSRKEKVGRIDLGAFNRVVAHTPEDMTATVEAGITLTELQTELGKHRQWLPVDPPDPERLTLGEIIDTHASGPRRFGYGTVRDYLIGITVALADGTVIKSGGKVVKNVAGYDLAKLFIGGQGTLGVVVDANFKLRPLPESENFVQARLGSIDGAEKLIGCVLDSELTPVILDLHRLWPSGEPLTVVAGFAGTREEVEWQLALAGKLGLTEPSRLDYDSQFRTECPTPRTRSVLPSRLAATLRELDGAPFVARAGNGIIYHAGAHSAAKDPVPTTLTRRLKDAFDPAHIFPEME
jgi:FAD/FMN-containing dehydrogenase